MNKPRNGQKRVTINARVDIETKKAILTYAKQWEVSQGQVLDILAETLLGQDTVTCLECEQTVKPINGNGPECGTEYRREIMYPIAERNNVTKCKLEDGSIVEYDACASSPNAYNTDFFELIGKGLLYSVNGKIQVNHKTPLYFYRQVTK